MAGEEVKFVIYDEVQGPLIPAQKELVEKAYDNVALRLRYCCGKSRIAKLLVKKMIKDVLKKSEGKT